MAGNYTGVGSRRTPQHVLILMADVAQKLADQGWVLRSGGAVGADVAFESGVHRINGPMAIYRPLGDGRRRHHIAQYPDGKWEQALDMAASVHPAWHRCSDYAKALHARNCFQVHGMHLDQPSSFLICWTPDGARTARECTRDTGGTGTAIRLADQAGIEVVNLAREEDFNRVRAYL